MTRRSYAATAAARHHVAWLPPERGNGERNVTSDTAWTPSVPCIFTSFGFVCLLTVSPATAADIVRQTAREIPVASRVDVVVVGGTSAAVAAAAEAASRGVRVFLAAPRPYLGEDLCATLRLELASGQELHDPLVKRLFPDGPRTTPLAVKTVLDQTLLSAGVQFLYGCYATDVLRDSRRAICGIAIANRAGRQAVIAKVIIDATDHAWLARRAGARCRPWPGGPFGFDRTVILLGAGDGELVVRHLKLPWPDGRFRSLAAAEQLGRDQTYVDGQLRAAETMFYVPPDPIVGRGDGTASGAAQPVGLGCFQPAGVDHMYVLSGQADVRRELAAQLLRPAGLIGWGRQVGRAAADQARRLPKPAGVRLCGDNATATVNGDIREILGGLRPVEPPRETITDRARAVPVLGAYDVVIVGGGTAGAPAAIGAARQGAKTLVIEYQHELGGTGTLGLITRPYAGKFIGFTKEVPFPDGEHNVEYKMQWYRRQIRRAGGEIWLGVLGCGALVERNCVKGAVVATPEQRGVVLARCVIDATGNADIAVAAGAESVYGAGASDVAMQGAGIPTRPLHQPYVNTDYLLVDESDMLDTWRALVGTRLAIHRDTFDVGTLIQTRERRRIAGDFVLRYLDQIAGRTYPDTIVWSASDYDSHGYPTDPFFALFPQDSQSLKANHPAPGGSCYTPYRCLLPRGLDGILVAGIGISMERDASALIRMQRDIQNQGYAAGVAAAMISRGGGGTRGLDVRGLQKHLIEIGNLPPDVLQHQDSFPLAEPKVREAVALIGQAVRRPEVNRALAVVLSHRDAARPMLQAALADAQGKKKLAYAKVLGFLGDARVVPTLIDAVERVPEWDAKVLQGKMAEYAHLPTPVDALIMALGPPRDARALPAIFRKLALLDATVTLSHHRAVALALEQIADPAAARPLARLLAKPGMSGHAMTSLVALPQARGQRRDRSAPLREIVLARALHRCGDFNGVGEKILRQYQRDLRGLLSRHAAAVLKRRPSNPKCK